MELTKAEKAKLAAESLTDCCAILAEESGGVRRSGDYDAYFVPETFWYHRVHLRPEAAGHAEQAVASVAEAVRAGGLPPLLSWLDTEFADGEILPAVRAAGYVPVTAQKAMYLSLAGRTARAVPPQIEAVPPDGVAAWSQMTAEGFGKPPETGGMLLLRGNGKADFLQWREGGTAAGGTLLVCERGNGGIHEVSALQQFRGRGIGSALVNRALDLAAQKGCACATLQASELGYPVYRKAGMEDVGTIHTWLLPPGT